MADSNEIPLSEGSQLIRTGRDGRQRFSKDDKRQGLEAFDTSGMSGALAATHRSEVRFSLGAVSFVAAALLAAVVFPMASVDKCHASP